MSSDITVTVRSPKDKHDVTVAADSTVKDLKVAISKAFSASIDQLCLIFSGKILRDRDTLDKLNIVNESIVHVVIKTSSPGTEADTGTSQEAGEVGAVAMAPLAGASAGLAGLSGMAGLSSLLGSGDFQQNILQEMFSNPEMLQSILQNPFFKQVMANPDLMRQMLSGNPQLQDMMQRNPQLLRMLENPDFMKMLTDVMADPAMMQEMMQGQQGMAAMPGGAAAAGGNPKQNMMLRMMQNPALMSSMMQSVVPSSGPQGTGGGLGMPGMAEMMRSLLQPAASSVQPPSAVDDIPQVRQPSHVSEPPVKQRVSIEPEVAAQVTRQTEDPEFQRLLQQPSVLDALNTIDWTTVTSTTLTKSRGHVSAGSQETRKLAPVSNSRMDSSQQYKVQLDQLESMGFSDRQVNAQVLVDTNGDLNAALERLLMAG